MLRFKGSAAEAAFKDLNLIGISSPNEVLIQVVSYNFDANLSYPNELLSTHALAMLLTVADDYKINGTKQTETFLHLTAEEIKYIIH